jgi:hypothetical protein
MIRFHCNRSLNNRRLHWRINRLWRQNRSRLLWPLSQSSMVEIAWPASSIQIRIVGGIGLYSAVIKTSQPGDLAADSDQLVGVNCIVAVHAAGDSKPHCRGRLNFIDDTVEVVAEHSSSQRLASRLEKGDHAGDYCVEGAEDGDKYTTAVACAQTCECGSEDDLGEKEAIGQSGCESIDVGLVPTTLESACIQRLRMRNMRLAWRESMRCDAHEIAELVVVVDGVAIGTLLAHIGGIVLE